MNVKTLKRFSRRSVSMLLSVLMVVSLFTVCMVGTSITASAAQEKLYDTTIRVYLTGGAAQSWENVYFYIGRESEYSGNPKWASAYKMTQVKDNDNNPVPYTYELNFTAWQRGSSGSADDQKRWDFYFFAGTNEVNFGNTTNTITESGYSGAGVRNDVWDNIPADLKTGDMNDRSKFVTKDQWNNEIAVNPASFEVSALQSESMKYDLNEHITAHKTPSTKKWGKTGEQIDSEHPDANRGYEKIYLVIGNNITRNPGAKTDVYEMVKQANGTYKTPDGFNFTEGAAYYFFTTIDPTSYAGRNKKIDDAYNYVKSQSGSGDKVTNKFTEKLTEVDLVVETKEYITATLYNYRSGSTTDGTGGQIPDTAQTTPLGNYEYDTKKDQSTGNESNYRPFKQYNQAVSAWYGSGSFTPLYAGNFRDMNDDGVYSVVTSSDKLNINNFVYLANVAEHGNAHSAALGLVDTKLNGNGTITQTVGGVTKEIPQFSDAFMKEHPTLQSKYPDLDFEVNANKHANGNIWYSYNSATDGNRYLDYDVSSGKTNNQMVAGTSINNQFFPFNKTNSDLVKCFGLKFEVDFTMTEDGTFNGEDLQFNFTGDDDLWVFIDGHLVLDMGGAHGAVKGNLNLSHNDTDHKYITGTVESDSYNNTTIAKMKNGNHQFDTTYNSANWTGSSWVRSNRETKISEGTQAYTDITDTTKLHKMTIFYMERGLFDSNLKFNFMLPQTNTLSLNQAVDNSAVNQGLKQSTMDVATKDVFNTLLQTQHMAATVKNIKTYPIDSDFTRKSPSESTTYDLQDAVVGTKTTTYNINSETGYTGVTAAYEWTDNSKLLKADGSIKTIQVDGKDVEVNAATGSGVGIPLSSGYIPLLYGQTAKFYDQFFTTAINVDDDPNVNFLEDEYIHKFDTSSYSNANAGLYTNVTRLDGQGGRDKRAKSTYYTTTFTVTDGKGGQIASGQSGKEFPYYNADLTTNKVDASINLNHVIKVGGISVKKEIDDSITTETTPNKNKEYKFKVEYTELFGDLDDQYGATGSTWKTMDRVTYTLTRKDNSTEEKTTAYTGADAGTFTLKEGETATITGIPVGTVVRVKELIEDDAEYEVKDITDGSGNKPSSTTKVVEKPMFITQGITNNTTYSYIIKNGLAMQTASLVVNNKVTTTGVNSGIATELEKIFNNDVFGYNVRTNSKGVSTNPAKLPITSAFTRTTGDGTTSDTLQSVGTTTGTKGNTGNTGNDTSAYPLKSMDAYYTWTDTSGRASGSGIGVPASGDYNVHLQYDQTATFDSQIVLDKDAQSNENGYVYVDVVPSSDLYKNNGNNNATTGMRAVTETGREVAKLYTTTYNITGANSTNGTAAYPKNASQLSANENVVIEYTFTNAVNLGKIQISKTVTDGSDANINPNGSYEFTLTYTKLFGKDVSETPAKGWEGTSSTGDTIITDEYGKFSIKKDETITFSGVPVQTDYKVTEVIPTGAKYAVKGATLTDKDGTDISSSHLTRSSNVCTVTGSLVNVADISKLTVDNTYSTVPVLYRYHNRVNTNGVPTSLQTSSQWTYFVKYVDGAISTFIDSGSITSDAKTAAIDAFGTVAIDNVLATYTLGETSSYILKTLTPEELTGTIAEDTDASVGYKASIQALLDNGNFYDGNKVILATIDNATRTYPVKVAYFKANEYNSTTKVNPMAEASTGVPDEATRYSADVPYNTVVPLNATITRLMLDDPTPTSNDSNGNYLFAYWEREVSYQSGNTVIPQWVPVSTNYQYSYKVVNPTNIRAVYRSTDGHNKKAYADYDTQKLVIGADNSFNALEGGTTTVPTYEKVPIPTYVIYWKKIDGVNLYLSTSGSYSISESVATTALSQANGQTSPQALIDAGLSYTTKYEKYKAEYLIPTGQEICLPANGYDAAATDKVVNPYVKQVGSTAQNRAVFDIVFGSAGSADGDQAITNVGYILFYGEGSNNYINPADEKVSDTNLKAIANAASPGTANLTDATKYPGSGKCRVAKYIADKDGTLGDNEIRLTNKNRVDLIIDVINDATSRNKFYTCYTYMIRGGQTYISNTPITFSPSEITLTDGGTTPTAESAYNLVIENYYQKNDGAYTVGDKNYTQANTYGCALSNAYTFANGKTLTFTIRPLQQGIYRGKLVKLMAGSNEIDMNSIDESVKKNGGQISYIFNKGHILAGADTTSGTLRLKAYFDPTPVAAKFTLNAKTGIEYNVYFNGVKQEDYTVTTTTGNKEVIVPFGKTVRVEAHTVLVNNGKEGYAITNATKGSFDLDDDSTRTKSQMAVKEVTVTDSMTSEQLQAAIGTQPTANKLVYNVTVRKARGTYGVNITYYNENAVQYTDDSSIANNDSTPNSATIQVWQGNPVITYADRSGTSYKEATTNATLNSAESKITITADNAVITVGGYAPLTLSPVENATTVVTVNGTNTTITQANQVVNVPYNCDETTGTDVTVTATAADGYVISTPKAYTKDDSSKSATKTVTLKGDSSVLTDTLLTTLPDVAASYVLTVNEGTGGHVTVSVSGTVISQTITGNKKTYTVVSGAVVTLNAVADSDYTFDSWTGSYTGTTASNQQITVDADKTITANFVATYTLSVTATTGGSVTVSGPGITGNDTVAAGETKTYTVRSDATNKTFTLNAIADTDYHFNGWSGALTGIEATDRQITLDGNKSVTASFEANGITITLDVSKTLDGGNKWSYTGDGAHIYVFYAKASDYNDNGWTQMTETSTDIYSALIPNGYTKVIFVRTTDGGWSGKKDQSPTGTNVYHTISETDTAWKVMGWSNSVKKLVTKTVTLNANSSVNWTVDSAVIKLKYNDGNQDVTIPMENTSGSIYSATITFPEGNEDITFQRVNPNNAGEVWGSAGANISSTVNWQVTGWSSVGAA